MILRKLFGGGGDDEAPPPAQHPWELKPGDFLKFGFTAPEGLAAEDLQIASVHALDLGGPEKIRRVLVAETGGGGRFLLWKGEGGELAVAREILRPIVERLFDIEAFGRLFDPDVPPSNTLERKADPADLAGWTTAVYRQEAAHEAYRHMADPADAAIGQSRTGDAEGLDFYRLVGDRRQFALEAHVFDGGRTDVLLITHPSATVVEEMWQR